MAAPVEPAALRGGPFSCESESEGCAQAFPAYPDDGEWECMDQSGAVVCFGGIAPAGVRTGPPDEAFACGAPLAGDAHGRRVCVDSAPDVPDGSLADWRCRFDRDATAAGSREVRRCERAPGREGLGAACSAAAACPPGMRCLTDRCALEPASGAPDCWLDADCREGATCVLGHCTRA